MTTKVITAREEDPIEAVIRKFTKYNISGLPVVDNEGKVKGMITTADVSKLIGE